ncbi:MAG: porin [Lutibacter sp.]|uniref:OprO/OprP family phosphate-selective porin n=1 Tax=Lutibacter sp. TaxID=1925666 RepID=UPI00385843FD
MKKQLLLGILLFSKIIFMQAQETHNLKSFWDNGFHIQSEDGSFKMKFGGRIQYQSSYFLQDTQTINLFNKAINGTEFRRIRFYNSGTIYSFISYKLQVDFTGNSTKLKDAYISINKIPAIGKFTIGHFKEPFGLDNLNSSNDMSFIERAPNIDMTLGRNNGFMLSNTAFNKRTTWALGTFKDTDNYGKAISNNYNLTGRITGLPITNENFTKLMHFGVAFSFRNPSNNEFKLDSKPEANLLPNYINTGIIEHVDNVLLTGIEFAIVKNSFSIQSEYINSKINRNSDLNSYNFFGYYIETSYFLTGEHKNYSNKSATFKRVSPKSNFNPQSKGLGAIELAIRYATTDYSDSSLNGGELTNFTTSVNWILNPATKFSFNYSLANLKTIGKTSIFQMKFQVVF